jgi:hypothetical protein
VKIYVYQRAVLGEGCPGAWILKKIQAFVILGGFLPLKPSRDF